MMCSCNTWKMCPNDSYSGLRRTIWQVIRIWVILYTMFWRQLSEMSLLWWNYVDTTSSLSVKMFLCWWWVGFLLFETEISNVLHWYFAKGRIVWRSNIECKQQMLTSIGCIAVKGVEISTAPKRKWRMWWQPNNLVANVLVWTIEHWQIRRHANTQTPTVVCYCQLSDFICRWTKAGSALEIGSLSIHFTRTMNSKVHSSDWWILEWKINMR